MGGDLKKGLALGVALALASCLSWERDPKPSPPVSGHGSFLELPTLPSGPGYGPGTFGFFLQSQNQPEEAVAALTLEDLPPDSGSWSEDRQGWMEVFRNLSAAQGFKSLFLLETRAKSSPSPAERYLALILLSRIYAQGQLRETALDYQLRAWSLHPSTYLALEIAQSYLFSKQDPLRARKYFLQVQFRDLYRPRQREIYEILKSRILFRRVDVAARGLSDPHVSVLLPDYDDIWIGTWNGGIARYTLSDGSFQVFQSGRYSSQANTVRAMILDSYFVYAGTLEGIERFSKATQEWFKIPPPPGVSMERVENLLALEPGEILVATLGQGIWKLRHETWTPMELGVPTAYITCLSRLGSQILIGTMDRGGFLWEPGTPKAVSLRARFRGPLPANVTFFLPTDGALWIGSYGEGLFQVDLASGTSVNRPLLSDGHREDWVLTGLKTSGGLYFGTLGGGLFFRDTKGQWKNWSLDKGGPSDVSSLVSSGSFVVGGTLGEGLFVVDEGLREESFF